MRRSVIVKLGSVLGLAACGSGEVVDRAGDAAGALDVALQRAMRVAQTQLAPWRCTATSVSLDDAATPLRLRDPHWRFSGGRLTRVAETAATDRQPPPVTFGVVSDLGDAGDPDHAVAIDRARDQLRAAGVDLVFAIGVGTDATVLEHDLGALGHELAAPIVLVEGDRDSATTARTATGALRDAGVDVLDGRVVRWIDVGGVTAAVLPGELHASRLAAGRDGCLHDRDDRRRVLGTFGDSRATLVVSAAAPRGPDTDGVAGPMLGDTGYASDIAERAVDVALYAAEDGRGSPARRWPTRTLTPTRPARRPAPRPTTALIAAGALAQPRVDADGHRVVPSVGVLRWTAAAWSWQLLAPTSGPGAPP